MKRLLLVLFLSFAISTAAASSLLYGSRSAVIRNTPGEIPVREEEPPVQGEQQDIPPPDEGEPDTEQTVVEQETEPAPPSDAEELDSLPEEEEFATPSDLKNKGEILSDVIAERDTPSDEEPAVLQGQEDQLNQENQSESEITPVEGELKP